VFEYIQHAKDYGIVVSSAKPDFDAMVKRSRGVADGMSKGVQFLMRKNKITILNGHGALVPGNKVSVKDESGKTTEYSAKHIIIATGGRAKALPNLPIDGTRVIEYRKAMTLEKMPKSMVVVGAGAIGVEFAYFYHTLGVEVTIVEFLEQGLLPREDADVSKELTKIYAKKGMQVLANTSVEKVDTSANGCSVLVKNRADGSTKTISCDIVLSAAGVAPNTEGIGLEQVGIKTDRGMILVDEYCRTNVPGVYAIGDVIPTIALAHVASAEGILCVEKIAGHHPEPLDYNNIPGCTFCSPEIASVGFTEKKAKEAGFDIKVGKFPFSASGKASAAGAKDGFVKVIYDAKYGELLGAHLIGPDVSELLPELTLAQKWDLTVNELARNVHTHPTLSEALQECFHGLTGHMINF
jgi:dihydrolipoamide dehydrogenase